MKDTRLAGICSGDVINDDDDNDNDEGGHEHDGEDDDERDDPQVHGSAHGTLGAQLMDTTRSRDRTRRVTTTKGKGDSHKGKKGRESACHGHSAQHKKTRGSTNVFG